MSKLTLTVNDDSGQVVTGDANNTSNTTYAFGTSAGQYDFIAFRFTGVTVPNAGTIRKATLRVNLTANTATTATFNVGAEDADNAAVLSTTGNDLGSRTYTVGKTHRLHDLGTGIQYLDITAAVQTVVNRAGWASGNAINIILRAPTLASTLTVETVESANDPKMSIVYGDSATGLTTFGSNTGSYTNPTNATTVNATYATMTNDTSSTHTFYNFGFAVPADATIDDILVQATLKVSSTSSKSRFGMELTVDGGTAWSTQKFSNQLTTTDESVYWGCDPDVWSVLPTATQVNDNTNFRIRLQNDLAGGTNDPSLDYIAVNVFYTTAAGRPHKVVKIMQAVNRASTY